MDFGKFGCRYIFTFMVLPQSVFNPMENMSSTCLIKHFISWLTYTREIFKKKVSTNNNASAVCLQIDYMLQ